MMTRTIIAGSPPVWGVLSLVFDDLTAFWPVSSSWLKTGTVLDFTQLSLLYRCREFLAGLCGS